MSRCMCEFTNNVITEECGYHIGQRLTAERALAAKDAEIAKAMAVLNPNMPESGLVDACKQVKQVAISEADNSEKFEAALAEAQREIARLDAEAALWKARYDERHDAAESALAAVTRERETAQAQVQALEAEVANIRAMEEQTARAYNAVRIHAGTFLAKLDECQPHIDDAFAFKAIHGIRYNGPNYGAELKTLKQSLGLTTPESPREREDYINRVRESTKRLADRIGQAEVSPSEPPREKA